MRGRAKWPSWFTKKSIEFTRIVSTQHYRNIRRGVGERLRSRVRRIGIMPSSLIRPACDISEGPRIAPGPCFVEGYVRPSTQNVDYLLPPILAALLSLPVPALPWPAGLRASPFLEPVLMPVVVPDFMLLDFIR